ncbi:hypothetical protein [Flavobacterium hercynium]|nr:hypothetical protein [Flavobacterium hercynium]
MIIASHSGMYANEQTSVRRVPGGWIYSTYHSFGKENSGTSKSESSVFVPFSNEFIEDLVVNISADKL